MTANCKSWSSRWDIVAKSIADLSDVISRKLSVPNAERIFFICHALRAGFTIEAETKIEDKRPKLN